MSTNGWDESPFLHSPRDLDVCEAIRALERLLADDAVKATTRVVVAGTVEALKLEVA